MNTLAFFDALFIISKLSAKYGDAAASEVHLLSYLSCLLSLYDGKAAHDWKYIFVVGNAHAPYAREMEESIKFLESNSLVIVSITDNEQYVKITDQGINELDVLASFSNVASRLKYLKAACDTLLLVALSSVKKAIRNEPTMVSVATRSLEPIIQNVKFKQKQRRQSLIDESSSSIAVLYDQFDSLKKALGDKHIDMLIPAITWLQFIEEKASLNINVNNNI